ncbi:MAG: flagellar motor stator protein MotA [Acidobacteriota bacterium]
MLPLAGILVVLFAVFGGFALENGELLPLIQPSELVIICGAACGTLLTANPLKLLRKLPRGIARVFRSGRLTRKFYVSTLVMLHAVFEFGRRNSAGSLEEQLDYPERSIVFIKHGAALRDPRALDFICDTLRLTTLGRIAPQELDTMLEQDQEARRQESIAPAGALIKLADALPGLGILSAVLGVVITMNSVRELPKVIGQKVGAALIGTFLGIFLSYGLVGPLAAHMERIGEAELQYYQILRTAVAAYARGMPVAIAIEFGRRSIPPELRPGFIEMERACRRAAGKIVEMPP